MRRSRLVGLLSCYGLVVLTAAAKCGPLCAAEASTRAVASSGPSTRAVASSAATAAAHATIPATAPVTLDADRLRAAILRLGSTSPRVREQATRELWSIGRSAEPALRAAAAGDDPEVAARARSVLQDFRLGISPDTPPIVIEAVNQYRQGDVLERRRALVLLGGTAAAADGRGPLLRLYAEEKDATWRKEILARLQGDGPAELARIALLGGEANLAAQLLADAAESGNNGAADFAAYALARGRIDQEIARLKTPPGPGDPPLSPRRNIVLAYLYRAKGDLAAARKFARETDPAAAAYIALYQGDYRPLEDLANAGRPVNGADAVTVPLGFRWLAGDDVNVRQAAELGRVWVEAHPDDVYFVTKALLLTDQRDAALDLLRRRGQYRTAFEVLEAQQRYSDALKVAAEAAHEPEKPGPAAPPERLNEAIYVRAQGVRLLAKLGEPAKARDAADALAQAADALRSNSREQRGEAAAAPRGQGARPVLRANPPPFPPPRPAPVMTPSADAWQALGAVERELGRPDRAVRHVLAAIDTEAETSPPPGPGVPDVSGTPLEALFPKRGQEAAVWWRFFRDNFPNGDGAGRVERVRDVMEGKADAGRIVEWARSIRSTTVLPPEAAAVNTVSPGRDLAALAETLYAYQQPDEGDACIEAAGRIDRHNDPFARAGEVALSRGDWERAAEWYARSAQRHPAAASVYLRGIALRRAGRAAEADEAIALSKVLPLGDEWQRLRLAEAMEKHGGEIGADDSDTAAGKAAAREQRAGLAAAREQRAGLAAAREQRAGLAAAREQEDVALRTCALGDYEGSNARRHWANRQATEGNFLDASAALRFSMLPLFRTNASFTTMGPFVQIPAVAHTWRARGLLKSGDVAGAAAEANAAVDAMPGNVEIAIELVNALDDARARPRADALFRRAATACKSTCWSFPNSGQAHNAAAWLAARCDRELGQGLILAQRAVELEPKNVAFIDTLAEVLFRLGRRDEAIEQMRRCIELDPKTEYFQKQLKRFTAPPTTAPATRPAG